MTNLDLLNKLFEIAPIFIKLCVELATLGCFEGASHLVDPGAGNEY
jgi:hypothetical protein